MRVKYACGGVTQHELAEEFGVSQSIVRGRRRLPAGGPLTQDRGRKLTQDEVRAIREAPDHEFFQEQLAARFEISQQMVSQIRNGQAHEEAGGPLRRASSHSVPLTLEQVVVILDRIANGERRIDIAESLGISVFAVDSIASGRIKGKGTAADRAQTLENVKRVRQLHAEGKTQREIAGQLAFRSRPLVGSSAAYPIQRRRAWGTWPCDVTLGFNRRSPCSPSAFCGLWSGQIERLRFP